MDAGHRRAGTAGSRGAALRRSLATAGVVLLAATVPAAPAGAAGDPPVANDDAYTVAEDGSLTVGAGAGVLGNDTDTEGDPLTAELVGGGPGNGTFTLDADGSFSFEPSADFAGSVSFDYLARDDLSPSNTATVTITVTAVNDAPVANDGSVSTSEDTPVSFSLTGADVDDAVLAFAVLTQPSDGSVLCSPTGSCDYTPPANFGGSTSFTFRANDGALNSNVATISITVAGANDPPVAAAQNVSATEDTPAAITLGASDPENDPLTFAVVTLPAQGTVGCDPATGQCQYTPPPDYTGADSFTFRADDGVSNSNVATVNVTVTAVNDPPVANPLAYTTPFNQRLRAPAASGLLTGALDPENDPLTAVAVSQPAHGTLTVTANGAFTYDPDPNFKGIDTFTYRADDTSGAQSAPATVTIGVDIDVTGTNPIDFFGTDAAEERGFTASLPRGLRIDLRGGGDGYNVYFGGLRGTVQVRDSGPGGKDRLVVRGRAANDGISVNGRKIRRGMERINYSGVEALDVRGLGGNDQFGVGSSSFPPALRSVSVDGGAGNDELFVNAGDRAAQVRGNTIIVAGWPVITYAGFERIDVSSTVTGTRTLSSEGYWLLASDGGVFTFGDAKFYGSTGALRLEAPIIQMIATPSGKGYWLLARDGGVFTFGDAKFYGSTGALRLEAPIIQMVASPSGKGYWLLASDGGVFTFGDAKFYGSTGALRLRSPVVQMIATPSGKGYWLRASDGGIFTFGDAKFYGSTGSLNLSVPIIQMVPSPSGNGYWLLAGNGAVFGFGAARFHGSTNTMALPARTVSLVPTPSGRGYWLLSADGSVFAFGDAGYYGSMIGKRVNAEVVQMIATPTGHGYWLLARDGGIFTFGDAKFHGSTGGLRLEQPITRMIVRGL